jgi:hypothetical protein
MQTLIRDVYVNTALPGTGEPIVRAIAPADIPDLLEPLLQRVSKKGSGN